MPRQPSLLSCVIAQCTHLHDVMTMPLESAPLREHLRSAGASPALQRRASVWRCSPANAGACLPALGLASSHRLARRLTYQIMMLVTHPDPAKGPRATNSASSRAIGQGSSTLLLIRTLPRHLDKAADAVSRTTPAQPPWFRRPAGNAGRCAVLDPFTRKLLSLFPASVSLCPITSPTCGPR